MRHLVALAVCLAFYGWWSAAPNAAPLPEAAPGEVGLSAERLSRLDTALQTRIDKGEIPGAVIAIARHGKLAHYRAFGWQDKPAGRPMRTNSIFRIYSMTKPIVSVAAMTMAEDATLHIGEPVGNYLPALKVMTVGAEPSAPALRQITIQDLLRHTSGITYGFYGQTPVRQQYRTAGIDLELDDPLATFVDQLAALPLAVHPGAQWEYGHSTDVLGLLLEGAAGRTLDAILTDRVLAPLGMTDTTFHLPEDNWDRLAEPFKGPPEPALLDPREQPEMLAGGHGMVSTAGDYLRFCQMLLNGGVLDGARILGRKTVAYMTANHLGPDISRAGPFYFPGPGYGFGLGFAVREAAGESAAPGSVGEYFWGGYGGTYFWVDPAEKLVVVYMMQSVSRRAHYRVMLRNLVYQAIID